MTILDVVDRAVHVGVLVLICSVTIAIVASIAVHAVGWAIARGRRR